MSQRKLRDGLDNLEKSLVNLERALTIPNDRELVVEGTIQRFETTIELFWKTLKRALEFEGLHPTTPRESVTEAFKLNWLHDEQAWLDCSQVGTPPPISTWMPHWSIRTAKTLKP